MSPLRLTGNLTFVVFALPFLLRRRRASRLLWRAYLTAHALHGALLIQTARSAEGGFSRTSRYGGAIGYATVAALTATSYEPGVRRTHPVHRLGQHVLFALYAFTIGHGYAAKGRDARVYGPLAALWMAAAIRPAVERR